MNNSDLSPRRASTFILVIASDERSEESRDLRLFPMAGRPRRTADPSTRPASHPAKDRLDAMARPSLPMTTTQTKDLAGRYCRVVISVSTCPSRSVARDDNTTYCIARLLRLLQLGDQLLGQALLRLRPQHASAQSAILFDGCGEGDQLGDVASQMLFDERRKLQSFVHERRIQSKVNLDMPIFAVNTLIELNSMYQKAHRNGALYPVLAVLVVVRYPKVPKRLEDKSEIVMHKFAGHVGGFLGRDARSEAAFQHRWF